MLSAYDTMTESFCRHFLFDYKSRFRSATWKVFFVRFSYYPLYLPGMMIWYDRQSLIIHIEWNLTKWEHETLLHAPDPLIIIQ